MWGMLTTLGSASSVADMPLREYHTAVRVGGGVGSHVTSCCPGDCHWVGRSLYWFLYVMSIFCDKLSAPHVSCLFNIILIVAFWYVG
jgi:hypothetical protein